MSRRKFLRGCRGSTGLRAARPLYKPPPPPHEMCSLRGQLAKMSGRLICKPFISRSCNAILVCSVKNSQSCNRFVLRAKPSASAFLWKSGDAKPHAKTSFAATEKSYFRDKKSRVARSDRISNRQSHEAVVHGNDSYQSAAANAQRSA